MTGERALALVLRGQAFGHLDGFAAVLVDGPQLERALLVHVKTQAATVGTERWETGERTQRGDLGARVGAEIDQCDFAFQIGAAVDREHLAIRAPGRMAIVDGALT